MDNISRLMFAVVMAMAYMAMGAEAQNTTMAPNSTMASNVTTAPVVNTTATAPTVEISRTECGKSQLCAAEPSDCNPAVAGSCFFVSTQQSSEQNISFQLRGVSSGYIAVGLSTDNKQGGNDTTYVCANNNGKVKFFTALLDNTVLTIISTLPVNSVKGSVNGQIIQCTFSATVPKATATRSIDTSFYLFISNGTFSSDTLGSPKNFLFSKEAVDLVDPNAKVTNSLNSAPSGHAFGLSQALLILLGVMML
ncbi:putative ferric-chelate reductase 1 [Salvelinus fontinalis]|uniref:putative ferric-chelate reductase 1 n=1 Tax=Salvelinus fontinalis TaxID=8038 RepID=UPI002486AD0F|nr:putative ferric-chelate reductase 1 [Salvelinus fontinalis]XP_055757025.1 putative ferric-chelate reductase 1 [Salvelinus fontinalis]